MILYNVPAPPSARRRQDEAGYPVWRDAGFEMAADAKAWWNVGIVDPREAGKWRAAGFQADAAVRLEWYTK